VVVSSDREVADSIKSLGARGLTAATLISRIGRA
jgi:hypothetical protein